VSFQLPLGIQGLLLLYPLNVCTDTILSAVHIEHTAISPIKAVCAALSLPPVLPFCAPSHSERLVYGRQTDRRALHLGNGGVNAQRGNSFMPNAALLSILNN
jgi:hypothetical protein